MARKRKSGLVLLHPPSVYDFRRMTILPGPVADLIPSGPFFEMYPIGFASIGEYLERHGIPVRIVNLAARMVEEPGFDPEAFLSGIDARAFGVSLHWLPHAQGALEVARLCKELHPDIPVIMGGYSASFYHRELAAVPEVDFIVRGDSTEEPLRLLLSALDGDGDYRDIPNITYRDPDTQEIKENPLRWVPDSLDHVGNIYMFMLRSAVRHLDFRGVRPFAGWWSYPVAALLTCRGCSHDCSFCGGSRSATGRYLARDLPAFRSPADVESDLATICGFTRAPVFFIGDIRQPGDGYADSVLEAVARVSPVNTLVFEMFTPPPVDFFKKVASSVPHFAFEISPESHDHELRAMAGKHYSNRELETSIGAALDAGAEKVDLFFMIGLAGQTRDSVMETVAYCESLLARFGPSLNPLIGPLAPFLDPGSTWREKAGSSGYQVLFETLKEHRAALLEPHWKDRLGYRTDNMDRGDMVEITYSALLKLNRIRGKYGATGIEEMRQTEAMLEKGVKLLERLDRLTAEGTVGREDLREIDRESRELIGAGAALKKQISWPVRGRRFRYLNIARMLIKDTLARR